LSADPHARSSNLDYLLEDEGEPRRGGAGKFVLILLALALAGGFGYLRWKNQKFGWLGTGTNKPSAAAQSSDATDTPSTTPPAAGDAGAATTPSIQPVPEPSSAAPANPAAASPAPSSTTTNPATGTTPAAPPSTPDTAPSSPAAATAPADAAPAAATSDNPPAPAASPKPTKPVDAAPPKPPAATKPAKPFDAVGEAQKYLYGKGVPQDCDRGMRLLKPAVNQSNPKAMIEMGALYSAGLCTPHDLPTAYRWFALALRKEPDNQAVQADLQKLWGEMTQPERQLAIKLSQ
jgi:hypothetical protein